MIGVHTPEYAFEQRASPTSPAVRRISASPTRSRMDNGFATWNNYRNRYWPAEYLIDQQGTVRHIEFGEGDYEPPKS